MDWQMDQLRRELNKQYYKGQKKDDWKDLKYLSIRIGLVFLLAVVVLSIW